MPSRRMRQVELAVAVEVGDRQGPPGGAVAGVVVGPPKVPSPLPGQDAHARRDSRSPGRACRRR